MSTTRTRRATAAVGAAVVLAAGVALASPSSAQIPAPIDLLALTRANTLVRFDPATPGTNLATIAVTGLGGDTLIGIDHRPANNTIVGIAADGTLYTIDPITGAATAGPTTDVAPASISGGVDFNPVPDRLRLSGSTEQNLRINPADGVVAKTETPTGDDPLAYAPADVNVGVNPNVAGAAYTNSFAPSPDMTNTTTLFVIDSQTNSLATQAPPNDGVLNTVGTLGLGDISDAVGFDIHTPARGTNVAYAAIDGLLYTVNLGTGAATLVGSIANSSGGAIVGLTVVGELPPPVVTTTTTAAPAATTATTAAATTPTTARVLARTGDEEGKGAVVGGTLLAAGALAVVAASRLRRRGTA